MEIQKPSTKAEENKIRIPELHTVHWNNELNSELIQGISIKGPDFAFKDMLEETPNFLTLGPSDLFNSIEEEYQKVKDFDFKKLDIKDIKKHIKSL
ncbi:MAG: hypothetical protein U9O94_07800 [Nanoarchaeota archaeon]|nr:hypothetical protein [Nanoarchaeota archaeon]